MVRGGRGWYDGEVMLDIPKAAADMKTAFQAVHGRAPSREEVQGIMAVSLHETGFGQFWKDEGIGSSNMVAQQRGSPPCGDDAFPYGDSRPQADGTSIAYSACFARFPDAVSGWASAVKLLTTARPKVWLAIQNGDTWGEANEMYISHFYEGHGKDQAERVNGYAGALQKGAAQIAAALGEPLVMSLGGGSGGSVGSAVAIAIGVVAGIGLTAWGWDEIRDTLGL